MNGHVKLDLLSSTGVVASTQELDNMVLPTITDFLQDLANMCNTAASSVQLVGTQDNLRYMPKMFAGTDRMLHADTFGLVLFDDVKPTDKNGYVSRKAPFAKAGSATATPTELLGSFVSATDILNDSSTKIGVKLIWDFPSITANGTIKALALTTREFCDNTVSRRLTAWSTIMQNIPYFNAHHGDLSPQNSCGCSPSAGTASAGRRKVSILDNAEFVHSLGGSTVRAKTKFRIGPTQGPFYAEVTDTVVAAVGFTDVFKVLDDAKDNQFIVFGTAPSGNRAVGYIDKTTGLTKSAVELSCLNAVNITDWGLCGKFLMILSYTDLTANSLPIMYAVNTETNTMSTISIPNVPAATGMYRWYRGFNTYRAVEGGYACDLYYNSWYTSGANGSSLRFLEIFESTDGTTIAIPTTQVLSVEQSYDSTRQAPALNIGTRPTAILNASGFRYQDNYNYLEMGFARRALFSLCNLDTPIVKTAGQVLRITYDLTWA